MQRCREPSFQGDIVQGDCKKILSRGIGKEEYVAYVLSPLTEFAGIAREKWLIIQEKWNNSGKTAERETDRTLVLCFFTANFLHIGLILFCL